MWSHFKRHIFLWSMVLGTLLVGMYLRFDQIGSNPAGFFCDEAVNGNEAYSILTTGRDTYGHPFPLFFRALGEFKSPLGIYAAVVGVFLFGPNEFGIRIVSFVLGSIGLGLFFLLGRRMYGNVFGLVLLAVAATNPWHVHMSRILLDGYTLWICLVLVSLYCFTAYLKNRNVLFWLIGISAGAFASYSYFAARLLMPIWTIVVFFITLRKQLPIKKYLSIGICLLVLILLPLTMFSLTSPSGTARWQQVSVFSEMLPAQAVKKVATSYLLHYSPNFLFLQGDAGMKGSFLYRHSMLGLGEFFWWQLPFFVIGLVASLRKQNRNNMWPVLLLLLLFSIPSSITFDLNPQATRSVIGIVPITILTGFGLWQVYLLLRKLPHGKPLAAIGTLCFLAIFAYSSLTLWRAVRTYPTYSSDYWGWQWGFKQSMSYFSEVQGDYDKLFITHRFNHVESLLTFFSHQISCSKCDILPNPIAISSPARNLYALRQEDIDEAAKLYPNQSFVLQKTLYNPGGKAELYVGEFKTINSSI